MRVKFEICRNKIIKTKFDVTIVKSCFLMINVLVFVDFETIFLNLLIN